MNPSKALAIRLRFAAFAARPSLSFRFLAQNHKMPKNDNRITPFGRILRVFRIDELPQIISIARGNMQFIGPRPERKIFVDQLNKIIPFYNVRHLIKPGITGWAQVKFKYGENLEDSVKKLEYDLFYIKNKSIMLDIRIIFKTITTVLFSRGI